MKKNLVPIIIQFTPKIPLRENEKRLKEINQVELCCQFHEFEQLLSLPRPTETRLDQITSGLALKNEDCLCCRHLKRLQIQVN